MQVNLQYAEEHLAELALAVDTGQQVEISRPDKPTLKLVAMNAPAAAVSVTGKRILGAGRGELRIPNETEWRALDQQLEHDMLDAPLSTSNNT